jgi:hypothetical protein
MRKITMTLIGLVFAFSANSQVSSVQSIGKVVAPEIPKAVLFDQSSIINSGFSSTFSNEQDVGIYLADDFELLTPSNITSITAFGFQNPQTFNDITTGINLYIYANSTGNTPDGDPTQPGSGLLELVNLDPTGPAVEILNPAPGSFNIRVDIEEAFGSNFELPPGNYWLVVAPSMNVPAVNGDDNWIWNDAGASDVGVDESQVLAPSFDVDDWVPFSSLGETFDPGSVAFIIEGESSLDFPLPYCGPLEFGTVEPLTNVEFAGISNRTDETVNGTPAHEDFTSVSGDVLTGESYEIVLEGNTNGVFTSYFAVFVDWNQNDVLDDDGEVYEITQTINGSDGNDGQQATQTLVVPSDALPGKTRMRVKKIFGNLALVESCLGSNYGQTEDYSINVTLPPFTAPYCGPLEHNIVEPMTNVEFAGFTNRSDAAVGGSPAHEDFTSVVGTVSAGESYEIILEGNTDGETFENRFAVFIDWNQNDVFDTDEVYAITTIITSSTGEDGQQAIQSIEVPVGATVGLTRMRVKKLFGTTDYLDPCIGAFYGQTEEYTLDVNTLSNTSFNSTDFTYYPNPVNDILSISTASTVDNIKVYNMLGQMVVETAPKVSNPQVDMKELQSGVYLVTLEVEGSLQTFRVIKQ